MGLEEKLPDGIILASVEGLANWARTSSLWPATFGLACCAIEMMATGAGRYDLARFGMEVFRPSPRQADLMIVAGRVSQKMAPVLRQIYDQMAEPKWVIAMGVCASSGGMFNNYAIVQGVDHVVPVDMYLPGCPPRPEMLMDAILKLHDKIRATPLGPNRVKAIERKGLPIIPYEKPADFAVREREEAEERTAARRWSWSGPMSELEPTGAGDFPGEQPVERKGMFGVTGPGDTSGYGGLVRPLPIVPSSTRPFDESNEAIYTSLERAFPQLGDAVERVIVQHGEMTIYVRREHLLEVAQTLRDAPELRFELLSSVSGVDYLGIDPTGRRLHSRLPPAVDDPPPPGAARGLGDGRGSPRPVAHLDLPHCRLAGARDLGLLRHRLRRPSRADPDHDAGRLGGPSPAQGLPARRRARWSTRAPRSRRPIERRSYA